MKIGKLRKFATGGDIPYIDVKKLKNPDPYLNKPEMFPDEIAGFRSYQDPVGNTGTYGTAGMGKGNSWQTAGSVLSKMLPLASNVINSFRRAPKPVVPLMDSAPSLRRMNMDNARYNVGREIASSNAAADRGLDGNTATAVKLFNSGRKLSALSDISAGEANANVQIANQQAMADAQTQASNNAKREGYQNDIKEGEIANQREQSQNFANAADKIMMMQNEDGKRKLDMQKSGILMSLYNQSGVLKRQGAQWKASGQPDPFGQDYKWLEDGYTPPSPISGSIKRMGGTIPYKA